MHVARGLSGPPTMPEISIESLDLAKAISYLGSDGDEESWAQFDGYHRAAIRRLEANGAEVALIASNTPHHRFETIVQGIHIPVVSILQEIAKESVGIGAQRVLLLGTALTMRSARFRQEFALHGIEADGPQGDAARKMTVELIEDLQLGKFAGAADRIVHVAKQSFRGQFSHQSVVCLACTELPLAFEKLNARRIFEYDGLRFINAVAVHVEAVFNFAVDC